MVGYIIKVGIFYILVTPALGEYFRYFRWPTCRICLILHDVEIMFLITWNREHRYDDGTSFSFMNHNFIINKFAEVVKLDNTLLGSIV